MAAVALFLEKENKNPQRIGWRSRVSEWVYVGGPWGHKGNPGARSCWEGVLAKTHARSGSVCAVTGQGRMSEAESPQVRPCSVKPVSCPRHGLVMRSRRKLGLFRFLLSVHRTGNKHGPHHAVISKVPYHLFYQHQLPQFMNPPEKAAQVPRVLQAIMRRPHK